jgi:hypothetical protein
MTSVMTGLKPSGQLLAQTEVADAVPDGTETALAIRAQAHAILALAAATAIDPGGLHRHEWHDVAGRTCADAE